MKQFNAATAVLLLVALAGCRGSRSTPTPDPDLAASIPSDTLAVAGIDLDRARAWPLYAKLPPGAAALFQPLGSASSLLVAYNGKEALVLARGAFREAPAGMALLANGLAAAGSPDAVRAAAAQRRAGESGAPWLLARAAGFAASSPIWAVARGGVTLPLPGDSANLNPLLQLVDYAAAGIRLDSELRLEAVAVGRDEPSARRFEENLRAMFTLAAAGARKSPLAGPLRAAQVRREGLTVRIALSVPPERLEDLLPGKEP